MKAIVAMDLNRVIGYKGRMPWHIPEDFKWFKKQTIGHSLIMGRNTFESIGNPLPGRFTYILTENKSKIALPKADECMYIGYDDLMNSLVSNTWFAYTAWVCGGASVYEQLLPMCDEVYATIIIDEYEGDTFMPHFEDDFPNTEILREEKDFWMVRYWK